MLYHLIYSCQTPLFSLIYDNFLVTHSHRISLAAFVISSNTHILFYHRSSTPFKVTLMIHPHPCLPDYVLTPLQRSSPQPARLLISRSRVHQHSSNYSLPAIIDSRAMRLPSFHLSSPLFINILHLTTAQLFKASKRQTNTYLILMIPFVIFKNL